MRELDEAGIRQVCQQHQETCVPTGAYHRQVVECACLATMVLSCTDCGEPIFVVPVTGLPGCEHFRAVTGASS